MTISIQPLVVTAGLLLVGVATPQRPGTRDGDDRPVCIHCGRHEPSARLVTASYRCPDITVCS